MIGKSDKSGWAGHVCSTEHEVSRETGAEKSALFFCKKVWKILGLTGNFAYI